MGIKNDLNNARQKALKRGDEQEAERLQLLIDGLTKIRGDRAAGLDTPAFQGPSEYEIRSGDNPFKIAEDIFGDQTAAQLIAEFNPELFVWDNTSNTWAFTGQPGDVLDLSFAFAPGVAGPFNPSLLDPGAGNKARGAAAAATPPGFSTEDYGAGQQLGLYGDITDPNRESYVNAPPDFAAPGGFETNLGGRPAFGAPGGRPAGVDFFNVPSISIPDPLEPTPGGRSPFGQPGGRSAGSPRTEGHVPETSTSDASLNVLQGMGLGGITNFGITGDLARQHPFLPQGQVTAVGEAARDVPPEVRGDVGDPFVSDQPATGDEAAQMLNQPIFDEETGRLVAPPEGTPMSPFTEFVYSAAGAITNFAASPSAETLAGLPLNMPNEAAQALATHFSAVEGVGMSAYDLMSNLNYFQADNGSWYRRAASTPAGTGSDLDYSRTYRSSGVRNHYRIRKGRIIGPGLPGPGPRPGPGPGPGGGGGAGGAADAVMWNVRFPERT